MFVVITCLEFINYLNFESNFIGLLYLIVNFVILFLLINMVLNFGKSNYKIRISKNLIVIVLGILSSYLLGYIIPWFLDYSDSSFLFVENIYVYSKVLKPILYVFLGVICILEILYKKEISKRQSLFKINSKKYPPINSKTDKIIKLSKK